MDIKPGDVVQIDPSHDERFGGCFMVVTDVKSWGATGFVTIPAQRAAFYRCSNEAMSKVGTAMWVPEDIAKKP